MKYAALLIALGALATPCSQAQDVSPSGPAGWVAVQWREHEQPIVAPFLFPTRADCEATNTRLHDIVKDTVHVERERFCKPLLTPTRS